jgi:hypothetical protein
MGKGHTCKQPETQFVPGCSYSVRSVELRYLRRWRTGVQIKNCKGRRHQFVAQRHQQESL